MNALSFDKQVQILTHLVHGTSVRDTARQTNTHRDSVMRVLSTVGPACAAIHGNFIHSLEASIVEVDELWSFIRKKQKRLQAWDAPEHGDCYTFVALAAVPKLVITWLVGKRDPASAATFVEDLRLRILGKPQITSDGWRPYIDAFENAFGSEMNYAMLVKLIEVADQLPNPQQYPQVVVNKAVKTIIAGQPNPAYITTAHVERQNLTIRMSCRRFARRTNAHSKTLANRAAAVALHFVYYNFCRVHDSLRVTPAMQAGIENEVWSMSDLLTYAKQYPSPPPVLQDESQIINQQLHDEHSP